MWAWHQMQGCRGGRHPQRRLGSSGREEEGDVGETEDAPGPEGMGLMASHLQLSYQGPWDSHCPLCLHMGKLRPRLLGQLTAQGSLSANIAARGFAEELSKAAG